MAATNNVNVVQDYLFFWNTSKFSEFSTQYSEVKVIGRLKSMPDFLPF